MKDGTKKQQPVPPSAIGNGGFFSSAVVQAGRGGLGLEAVSAENGLDGRRAYSSISKTGILLVGIQASVEAFPLGAGSPWLGTCRPIRPRAIEHLRPASGTEQWDAGFEARANANVATHMVAVTSGCTDRSGHTRQSVRGIFDGAVPGKHQGREASGIRGPCFGYEQK